MSEESRLSPSLFALSRFVHREIIVLLILCGAAVALFLVTKASAAAAHRFRARDARIWYERGVADLEAGRTAEAVTALGRARALDRSREDYHLAFSRALAAAGELDAARQTLRALRETRPEDPDVNSGLARLEARSGHTAEAVRFYQSALYGAWQPERLPDRERLRVELIEYLIASRMPDRALAHLVLLAADLPADPARQFQAAGLFLAAGDPARALALYRRVLAREPENARAHAGAGRAAFALGDFATARRHFDRAPEDAGTEQMRTLAQAVIDADPLEGRLSSAERRRRLAAGVAHLSAAVESCRARVPDARAALAEHAKALRAAAAPAARPFADPDAFESAVAVAVSAAAALPAACGPPDVTTEAWRLMARAHEGRLR